MKASSIRVAAEWFAGPDGSPAPVATDLILDNLEPRSVEARLSFETDEASSPLSIRLSAGPFESVELQDVLGEVFGISGGAGTLSLELPDGVGGVVMSARTRAREPGAGRAVGGSTRYVVGLSQTDSLSTEIEAANGTDAAEFFAVRLLSAAGEPIGVREGLSVRSGERSRWALRDLFPVASGEAMTAELSPAAGSLLPAVRVAVTDLWTASRVAFAPDRPASRVYLPVDGRTSGSGDTFLATDADFFNAGFEPLVLRVRFLERGLDNEAAPAATLLLRPRETRRTVDVLGSLFGLSETSGFLEVVSERPDLLVAGRLTARSEETPGTAGAAVRPVADGRFSTRSLLVPAEGGLSVRVALLNPGAAALPALLRWIDGSGRVVAETATVVPGAASVEVEAPPGAEAGEVVLVEADRPHFALLEQADRIRPRPGDGLSPKRVAR